MLVPVVGRAEAVKVVVNAANPSDSMTREKVADLFLKKATRWESGRVATPVDQSDKRSVRGEFSQKLLVKEVAWVKSYWQKMIFSGRATPPAELSSDGEVLEFVRANPDAIGYVSEGTPLTAGIKPVAVKD
ncbi:MAG: phosphate ABC transporter substrate-binding protein [Thermoanaerobaculia bacterium]|nr:phosphate ABC transporter substrate-binding protein [Thermoanaerobaculia bacterium]